MNVKHFVNAYCFFAIAFSVAYRISGATWCVVLATVFCALMFLQGWVNQICESLAKHKCDIHIINAARAAHTAWLAHNAERLAPDLANHYTARQQSTDFAHAMLRLGSALEEK